jgi:hypothetical protein
MKTHPIRIVPHSQRYINILGVEALSKNHQVLMTDDPKASYMFTRKSALDDPLPQLLDLDKVDYSIPPPKHLESVYKDTYLEGKGLPLSFMSVQTVEEGEQWYREHTRYPDAFVPILARYQWGDLKQSGAIKRLKRERKQNKKKKMKSDNVRSHIKHEHTVLTFD